MFVYLKSNVILYNIVYQLCLNKKKEKEKIAISTGSWLVNEKYWLKRCILKNIVDMHIKFLFVIKITALFGQALKKRCKYSAF